MKAILEFNFDDPESDDRVNFQDCIDGVKWKLLVWELDQELRSKTKYAPDNVSEDTYEAYEEIREMLRRLINDDGLKLD
jgi:hypothetical protein